MRCASIRKIRLCLKQFEGIGAYPIGARRIQTEHPRPWDSYRKPRRIANPSIQSNLSFSDVGHRGR